MSYHFDRYNRSEERDDMMSLAYVIKLLKAPSALVILPKDYEIKLKDCYTFKEGKYTKKDEYEIQITKYITNNIFDNIIVRLTKTDKKRKTKTNELVGKNLQDFFISHKYLCSQLKIESLDSLFPAPQNTPINPKILALT